MDYVVPTNSYYGWYGVSKAHVKQLAELKIDVGTPSSARSLARQKETVAAMGINFNLEGPQPHIRVPIHLYAHTV